MSPPCLKSIFPVKWQLDPEQRLANLLSEKVQIGVELLSFAFVLGELPWA